MLTDIDCAEPEVEAKLELKPDKAAGSDGFLPKVLKAVAGGVVPHLCQIFNRSLTTAEVLQDFRSADVCPIPKKGLLTETGNYRPISLTSVPGKVLESQGLFGLKDFSWDRSQADGSVIPRVREEGLFFPGTWWSNSWRQTTSLT